MNPETTVERDQRLEQFTRRPFASMPEVADRPAAERRHDSGAAPGEEAQRSASAPGRRYRVKRGLDDRAGFAKDGRRAVAHVGGELRKELKEISDMRRGQNRSRPSNYAALAPIDVVDETVLNPPRDHEQHRYVNEDAPGLSGPEPRHYPSPSPTITHPMDNRGARHK